MLTGEAGLGTALLDGTGGGFCNGRSWARLRSMKPVERLNGKSKYYKNPDSLMGMPSVSRIPRAILLGPPQLAKRLVIRGKTRGAPLGYSFAYILMSRPGSSFVPSALTA